MKMTTSNGRTYEVSQEPIAVKLIASNDKLTAFRAPNSTMDKYVAILYKVEKGGEVDAERR